MDENEKIYIVPKKNDKPIKIVYECLPCPIDSEIRCKYAQFKETEPLTLSMVCENITDCNRFKININDIGRNV